MRVSYSVVDGMSPGAVLTDAALTSTVLIGRLAWCLRVLFNELIKNSRSSKQLPEIVKPQMCVS